MVSGRSRSNMNSPGSKWLNILFVVSIALIIYLPLMFMHHGENVESLIDNRFLYEWDSEADPLYPMMNRYVNDRIGFRDVMLRNQMIVKDRLFFEPVMARGKDGHIFSTLITEQVDHEFLDRFGEYLSEVKRVCDERSIPFLFMLNPTKTSIYPEMLPDGYIYHRLHPQAIENTLEKYEIPYISTYYDLKALADQSIEVFNAEYDQNHWNDLGMFHGINVMLGALKDLGLHVELNEFDDYTHGTEMKYQATTHPFPLEEEVPNYSSKLRKYFKSVKDDYEFPNETMENKCLGVYANSTLDDEDAERLLIYQGSYMNRKIDFVIPQFKETMIIHSYHAIQFFEDYIELFEPDVFVFEQADYSLTRNYYEPELTEFLEP